MKLYQIEPSGVPAAKVAEYKGKRVLVLWSGGVDSTALAIALLEAKAEVTLLEIDTKQTPNYATETEYRRRQVEWFHDQFKVSHTKFELGNIQGRGVALYQQSMWWLSIALMHQTDAYDYIAIGWVASDSTSARRSEYLRVFNASSSLLRAPGPKLVFPFATVDKWFMNEVYKPYSNNLPEVWWCEHPVFKRKKPTECGKCPSCLDAYDKSHFDVFARKHPYFKD